MKLFTKPASNRAGNDPQATSFSTDVLVVGGGTGGTSAALQSARMGVNTILVSELDWLGGMLTAAGVCAPDGNELESFQTGIWGAFLRELMEREVSGLDHAWVSFFTYQPKTGAQIFHDWVTALPNLTWLVGHTPSKVHRQGDRITGVEFEQLTVQAKIIIDGTELGDLLEFGDIPYRLGWELQEQWQEPSAPIYPSQLTQDYPVQAPTWVVYLQDFAPKVATSIPGSTLGNHNFQNPWKSHGKEAFLTYGAVPDRKFMMNWPTHGNDYGEGVARLFQSPIDKAAFLRESLDHSQNFACYVQAHLNPSLGLAEEMFPTGQDLGGGAFALQPYYRESRRLVGVTTVVEQDLLPQDFGPVAPLPTLTDGSISAIAIGNYVNDHHYPSGDIQLAPKSMIWGGRWTGTAFTIPYGALIPETIDGFLVCEKNISVSHMANGATRLQPVVLGLGQAAGAAAALSIQQNIQPRQLAVRDLQNALINDPIAPAAVIPFYNLPLSHPNWAQQQFQILDNPASYASNGCCSPLEPRASPVLKSEQDRMSVQQGQFQKQESEQYYLQVMANSSFRRWQLVTLNANVHEQFKALNSNQSVEVKGWKNDAANWIRVAEVQVL